MKFAKTINIIYICGVVTREIRCPECAKVGNSPALLGVVVCGEGTIVLKCKKCKSVIRITFDKDKILCKRNT